PGRGGRRRQAAASIRFVARANENRRRPWRSGPQGTAGASSGPQGRLLGPTSRRRDSGPGESGRGGGRTRIGGHDQTGAGVLEESRPRHAVRLVERARSRVGGGRRTAEALRPSIRGVASTQVHSIHRMLPFGNQVPSVLEFGPAT